MDGGEGEASGQAAGGGAGVHPGEFEGDQGEREVLGSFDEAALFGIHEDAGDAGFVEGLEQSGFLGGPLMGVAGAVGDQAGDRSAGDGANRLHQHLQVVAVGEAPEDLADMSSRQSAKRFGLDSNGRGGNGCSHGYLRQSTINFQGMTNKCSVTWVIGEGDGLRVKTRL